jgi:hypothetical protein
MRSSKVLRAILGLSLGVTLYASTAQAQTEDKRTFFTISGPIALPGMTLPAGRYIFHIVDTTTTRKVIQVMSEDGKKPFVMANTIPDQRRDAPKDATVAFYETPKGTPAAVKTWWYPGESIGYQFIYPRAQAKQIAHNTGKAVLTTKSDSTKTEETKSAALTRVDENGRDTDVDAAGAQVAANSSQPNANANQNASASSGFRDESANPTVFNRNTPAVTDNSASRTPQVAQNSQRDQFPAETSRTARNELPKTASNLPFVAFIGMLSALGFVTLRYGTTLRS